MFSYPVETTFQFSVVSAEITYLLLLQESTQIVKHFNLELSI